MTVKMLRENLDNSLITLLVLGVLSNILVTFEPTLSKEENVVHIVQITARH